MKPTAYISLFYGLTVFLSGIMAYTYEKNIKALYIEFFVSIIILGNIYFLVKEKKLSYYLLFILSSSLTIFYGYEFSNTHKFFYAFLVILSFFVAVHEFLKIFKVFGSQ